MKRITRRQARSWLSPMRDCFLQMLEGEVDAINGYPVTRLHHDDDYARIDYCIAGFRALLDRLCPEIDTAPLARLEKRLANACRSPALRSSRRSPSANFPNPPCYATRSPSSRVAA